MIYVGASGWSYEDWKGVVYPGGKTDQLEILSGLFKTLEINSTFYRPATAWMARSWAKKVAHLPDFLFTAKLWQRFTHGPNAAFSKEEVEAFNEGMKPLADAQRLGAVLAQFSFAFVDSPAARERLEHIAECFGRWPLVVEVRHASWAAPGALALILKLGYSLAATDQPMSKLSMPPVAKGPIGYMRLHGRNRRTWFKKNAGRDERYDYLYSPDEMQKFADEIRAMDEPAKKTFVFTNNHYGGQAVANALELRAILEGRRMNAPASLIETYPNLADFAEPIRAPRQGKLL